MMRGLIPSVLIAATIWVASGHAHAEDASDLDGLRRDWHRCVRQNFSGQPVSIEKRAAERAALTACKAAEDAYVAAELASRSASSDGAARKDGLTSRARAWISSVAAYVVDPVASWFGR